MKNNLYFHNLGRKIISLLLISITITCFAQMKLAKPRAYVRNEMIADVVSVSTNLQINNSDYIPESKFDTTNIKINRFNAYALPLILKANEKMLIVAGGSYSLVNISNKIFNQTENNKYQSITADLLAVNNHGERFYTLSYFSCGSFSDKPFDDLDKSFKVMALVSGGYKWNENLSAGLGAVYFSNLGDPLILPSVRLSYSPSDWLFYLWFPSGAEIRYLTNNNLHFITGCTINSEGYYDTQTQNNIKLDEIKSNIGLQYRIFSDIWLKTMLEYTNTEIETNKILTGTTTDQLRLEIKLSYIVPSE